MGVALTCPEIISRIRQQTGDIGAEVWTDASVLQAVDQALESIWTSVKLAHRGHLLQSEDVPIAQMQPVNDGTMAFEYDLPEHMAALEQVSAIVGGRPIPMVHGNVADLDAARMAVRPFYVRVKSGRLRLLRARAEAFRFWYYRRWPPMHYGVAQGGTETELTFAASPIGQVKRRPIYKGTRFEFLSGANADKIVECVSFNPATMTATIEPALPHPVTNGDQYSMLVPMDGEHGDYVAVEASLRLLQRQGNTSYLQSLLILQGQLHDRFIATIHQRDMDHPRYV